MGVGSCRAMFSGIWRDISEDTTLQAKEQDMKSIYLECVSEYFSHSPLFF